MMTETEKFLAQYRRQENSRKWLSVAPNGAIVVEYGRRPLQGTVVASYDEARALSDRIRKEG